jgi:hypothetical protein
MLITRPFPSHYKLYRQRPVADGDRSTKLSYIPDAARDLPRSRSMRMWNILYVL